MSGKRTPAGLGPGGRKLWQAFDAYELDPGDAELLLEAVRTKDTLDQLAGDPKQAVEARQQRLVLAKLLQQLRPASDPQGASVSDSARAVATARWKGRSRGA
jgi:hypothetical protein